MTLNIDIIDTIGSFCDSATYFNLCLADKSYYSTQTFAIRDVYDKKIMQHSVYIRDMCERTTSSFSRLKVVHQHYRFMLKRTDFLYRYRRFIDIMLSKLDEYIIPNAHGVCMGIVPYKKYRKALLAL